MKIGIDGLIEKNQVQTTVVVRMKAMGDARAGCVFRVVLAPVNGRSTDRSKVPASLPALSFFLFLSLFLVSLAQNLSFFLSNTILKPNSTHSLP